MKKKLLSAHSLTIAALAFAALSFGCSESSNGDAGAASDGPNANGADWKTVVTLTYDAPVFQEMDNLLVSEPFSVSGEVRLAMKMEDAGPVDGLVGVIIPADQAADPRAILGAIGDGVSVILIGAAPEQVYPDLDGSYVFVNAVPAPKAWSLEIQVRP